MGEKRGGRLLEQSPNSSTVRLPPEQHARAGQLPATPFVAPTGFADKGDDRGIARSSQAFRTLARHLAELAAAEDDGIERFRERRVTGGVITRDDLVHMRGILTALASALAGAQATDREAIAEAFTRLEPIARRGVDG